MKILRRWSKFERWSMYDSDDIHYVEVEDDGKKYVFSEIDRELTEKEIVKLVEYHKEKERESGLSKQDRAIVALNKYDYHMGKSAQSAQWLINEMQRIFESR